jgi:putative ABC transport system permease protein
MSLLRNLGRRRLRTTLTVLGIVIGIWALVVFSSMANKINSLVGTGTDFYAGKVVVSDGSSSGLGMGLVPIDVELADQIATLEGVGAVEPRIEMPFEIVQVEGFAIPKLVVGSTPGADRGLDRFTVEAALGRLLTAADEGSDLVVLGSDIARELGATVGGTIKIREVPFQVVGILQATLSPADMTASLPLAAAQELFHGTLPPTIGGALDARSLATQIVVYPAPGADPDAVADRIEATAKGVTTVTATDWEREVGGTTLIFNAILTGVALISLVVGGLSVINTMAMSVTERTREIGIKRAIGGSRRRIVRELVAEAGAIGFLGGLIGLGLGALVVFVANELGRSSGTSLFDLTPGTALFAVVFSTVLGMVAGVVPAWNAARLDPVAALRYQ